MKTPYAMTRPLLWVASAKKDLVDCPKDVQAEFGHALYLAQIGIKHANAKPLKGFGGSAVLEVVEDHSSGTYRAVYTVRFADAIYVLHVFQKKSKHGAATPQSDIVLIRSRLQLVEIARHAAAKTKRKQ